MTKDQLAQELKDKLKAGIKPSDLKKLKRSKSADDINPNPPTPLLQDQLKEKQQEVEELRKQLEQKNEELKTVQQELDNSLASRVAAVKVFGQEHDKRTKVERELNETIEEASEELITSDKNVSNLRTKLSQAQQEINRLSQALKQEKSQRNTLLPSPEPWPSLDYLKYPLYSLLAVWFVLMLNNSTKVKNHD